MQHPSPRHSASTTGSLLGGPLDIGQLDTADGDRIVNHVFGDNRDQVVSRLGGSGGGGNDLLGKLLPMLAPLVMSFLSKQFGGGSTSAAASGGPGGGLSDILGGMLGGGGGQDDLGDLLGGLLGGGRR